MPTQEELERKIRIMKRNELKEINIKIKQKEEKLYGFFQKWWDGEELWLRDREEFYHTRLGLKLLEKEKVDYLHDTASEEYVDYLGKAVSSEAKEWKDARDKKRRKKINKMKKTICTLALAGLSFLNGCYKPEANLRAKNAPLWPIQGFTSVTGKRFPYCEEEFKYDEFGRPQIIRRYYEVNPNGLDQLAAKVGIYLTLKSKGIDLLELQKKLQRNRK